MGAETMRLPAVANDLELYRERVRYAIGRRTGKPILNGSVEHAAVLVEESLLAAQDEVLLLSSNLDEACFGRPNVVSAVRSFLVDPHRRLRVLVERSQPSFQWENHPFVESALRTAQRADRVEFAAVPPEWVDRYRFNFLVVDRFGYRYQEDRDELAAVACFLPDDRPIDADDSVMRLHGIFDQLAANSVPLRLPVAA